MTEAENLCDRIAIMDKGKVVALDTPDNLRAMVPGNNGDKPTLEDVFLELTGRQLVNEDESVEGDRPVSPYCRHSGETPCLP